jgi:hypothetical protein
MEFDIKKAEESFDLERASKMTYIELPALKMQLEKAEADGTLRSWRRHASPGACLLGQIPNKRSKTIVNPEKSNSPLKLV